MAASLTSVVTMVLTVAPRAKACIGNLCHCATSNRDAFRLMRSTSAVESQPESPPAAQALLLAAHSQSCSIASARTAKFMLSSRRHLLGVGTDIRICMHAIVGRLTLGAAAQTALRSVGQPVGLQVQRGTGACHQKATARRVARVRGWASRENLADRPGHRTSNSAGFSLSCRFTQSVCVQRARGHHPYNQAMLHSLNAMLAPALMERLVLVINHVLGAEPVGHPAPAGA